MATSVYFNNQNAKTEQFLLEDLIIESIKNHGIDVYYIPRSSQSELDELFGDDPVKYYSQAIKIEVYLETFKDYDGNKEFFSKFGLEIQESARLVMSRYSFNKYVTSTMGNSHICPKEGDLIYLPVQYKLMEIKFVEEEKNFFQLGKNSKSPYMYGLSVEAFKYSGELLNTGIDDVDNIANLHGYGLQHTVSPGGTGTYSRFEIAYQGESLANANAKGYVSYWNKPTGNLCLRNIQGAFVNNEIIIGATSNARWTLNTAPNVLINVNESSMEDNYLIETEANNIIDFSESNPFGEP